MNSEACAKTKAFGAGNASCDAVSSVSLIGLAHCCSCDSSTSDWARHCGGVHGEIPAHWILLEFELR